MRIDPTKKYRTTIDHLPVRILCTDRIDPETNYTFVIAINDGHEEHIHCIDAQGHFYGSNDSLIEEVPPVDWAKVAIDTPVWITSQDMKISEPRHFAGVDGRKFVFCFPDGLTSHTVGRYHGIVKARVSPELMFLEDPLKGR